ncbi:MAG: hypothetical protein ISR96_08455 [Nitrospira sp.]|nr:hypothetical protein [bacterium]MBL7049529.1 hypothetical protein [Nitrospira sp.]
MIRDRAVVRVAAVVLCIMFYSCGDAGRTSTVKEFKKLPELQNIRPPQPVQIKVKRSVSGQYSWELKSADPERIIETDAKLRGVLKAESSADVYKELSE